MKRSALKTKPMRPKACRHCRKQFTPRNAFQVACSIPCAVACGQAAEDRKRKRERSLRRIQNRLDRERIRPRSEWLKLAQAAFNAWVVARDRALPCVSCDTTGHKTRYLKISGWVASHYRSVGACPELRFDPLNVHKACVECNSHLSGNIVEYRIRLRVRIGDEALERLEGPHEAKKYTIDELREIRDDYRSRKRELLKEQAQRTGPAQ